jgi:hypothetical protein
MNTWNLIAAGSVATLIAVLACGPAPAPVAPPGAAACNNQPNMAAALESLHHARESLERAEHDKGGWRVKAVESTEVAVRETERGCAFADTH